MRWGGLRGAVGLALAIVIDNGLLGVSPTEYNHCHASQMMFHVGSLAALTLLIIFISLAALPLLPSQKGEAQRRKRDWPEAECYMWFTICLLTVCLIYSLTVNFLSLNESTMCMRVAGGEGCDEQGEQGALGQIAELIR